MRIPTARIAAASLALLSRILASGCGVAVEHAGSGVSKTDVRTVAPFTRIEIAGALHLVTEPGESARISLTADDNLLPLIHTEVEGGTLRAWLDSGSYRFGVAPTLHVAAPTLAGLAISGAAEARIAGLAAPSFDLSITGAGDVRAAGRVDELHATVSGAARMELYDLVARKAKVDISGAGEVEVNATETLDANVSGVGRVRYKGKPAVHESVAGMASVKPAD